MYDDYDTNAGAGYISSDDDMSSVSSVNTRRKNQRGMFDSHKKSDPGYRKIQIGRNHKGKKKHVEYYVSSHIPGTCIRDAITGARIQHHRVGQAYEDLYFKVSYADNNSTNSIDTLFYDSPEQYERHLRIPLSSHTKAKWLVKYNDAVARYRSNDDYSQ